MNERITGRMNDGTAFVHSETGNEGVGHFTTQRRLPEIVSKLANLEDKIENGELVEVKHGYIIETVKNGKFNRVFSCCGKDYTKLTQWIIPKYCPNCGAKMDERSD